MNKKLMMAMLAAGSVLTMTNALAAAGDAANLLI